MHRTLLAAIASLTLLAAAGSAPAAVIPFDPDGPGPAPTVLAGSFDFLPGNIFTLGGNNPVNGPNNPNVKYYYQARLGAVLDGAGQVIPTPGLNSSYEITAVFGINTNVINLSTTIQTIGSTGVVPSGIGYFSLYYGSVANASDLAGTGFRDGTRILSALPNSAYGIIADYANTGPLDRFNPTNYAGALSDIFTGQLRVAADATSVLPAFFPGGANFHPRH